MINFATFYPLPRAPCRHCSMIDRLSRIVNPSCSARGDPNQLTLNYN